MNGDGEIEEVTKRGRNGGAAKQKCVRRGGTRQAYSSTSAIILPKDRCSFESNIVSTASTFSLWIFKDTCIHFSHNLSHISVLSKKLLGIMFK